MTIRILSLAACVLAAVATTAAASDRQPAAKSSFGSEAEFVALYGAQAQKVRTGEYQLQRGDVAYQVKFGTAALRASLAEAQSQLDHLALNSEGTERQHQRAQLEKRRDALSQQLAAFGTKAYDHQTGSISQCGFGVALASTVTPQMIGGFSEASATVSPAGSIPSGGWHAVIDLYATAAQPDFMGGLYGRVDDYVGHVTYDHYTSPYRDAYAYTNGWYTCLRATSTVSVIAPSGNPWFPNYCGNPIYVVALHADSGCPTYY